VALGRRQNVDVALFTLIWRWITKLALKKLVGDSIHIQPIFDAERQASFLPAFREAPIG